MLSSLSVFFPCYNEGENLSELVHSACTYLPTIAEKFEVIIVDDGSRDDTKNIVATLQKECAELRIVSHETNKGYGAALKTGIESAQMEWVFWMDGDLQFEIDSLEKFIDYTPKYDAIIGYRAHRADTFLRKLYGEIYTQLINFLFGLRIRDIDCAFKLIRADRLRTFGIKTSGMFTSAEILIRLKRIHVNCKQIPVTHFPRKFGRATGANFKVIIKGFKEIFFFFVFDHV